MHRRLQFLFVAAAASLALSASCAGSSDQAATGRSSSPTPAATPPTSFDGAGYHLTVPKGWLVRPAVGHWYTGASPITYGSGFDTFTSQDGDPWMVIGRRHVATGVSLERWVRRMTASHTITYPPDICVPPEKVASARLGGEPAVVRSFHCPGESPKYLAVQILAIHDGHGYLASCGSPNGKVGALADLETVCSDVLRDFGFVTAG